MPFFRNFENIYCEAITRDVALSWFSTTHGANAARGVQRVDTALVVGLRRSGIAIPRARLNGQLRREIERAREVRRHG